MSRAQPNPFTEPAPAGAALAGGAGAAPVDLLAAIERCQERARAGGLTLQETLDELGGGAYSFACLVLSVPFVQPISLGPLATVGGLAFAALGWQLAAGRPARLPGKLGGAKLSPEQWGGILGVARKIAGTVRRFCRPGRLPGLVDGRRGQQIGGAVLLAGGALMAFPFFGIPFNNMFPAIAILCAAYGLVERDGLMTVRSFLWLGITAIYFTLIVGAFAYLFMVFGIDFVKKVIFEILPGVFPKWLG